MRMRERWSLESVAKKQRNQREKEPGRNCGVEPSFEPRVEGTIMAQSGFAFFFLAVLIGCSFAVAAWVRMHWQKIVDAVCGEAPAARPIHYRSAQRRPIDIPYVAQRMLPQPGSSVGGSADRRLAWTARPHRPSGYQLAFGF